MQLNCAPEALSSDLIGSLEYTLQIFDSSY